MQTATSRRRACVSVCPVESVYDYERCVVYASVRANRFSNGIVWYGLSTPARYKACSTSRPRSARRSRGPGARAGPVRRAWDPAARAPRRGRRTSLSRAKRKAFTHTLVRIRTQCMRRRGAACDPLSLRQQSAHSMHSRPTANPKPLTINGFCVKAFLTSSLIRASFSAPSVDLRMSPHSSAYLIRGEKG